MKYRRILLVVVVALTALAGAAVAQDEAPKPALPPSVQDALDWRCIGPANMGGRITALAVARDDSSTWWAATASGGLLKTTNNGVTFEHQFDREKVVSIGDVAVAPSNPEVVWVGTGESNPRNSVSWGNGVYRSTDGGKTWKHRGLEGTFQIGRIAIHPENPDVVYVGALGRLWGANDERGVYKTTDGGETWDRVLFVDDVTGVIDLRMKPGAPETLIAATYERKRDGFDANDPAVKFGAGAALWRTDDGGANWRRLESGLPTCKIGRIGIDFWRKNPDVIYAVVETERIAEQHENAPYIGVTGANAEVGARITKVVKDGPAAAAGMKEGDIVIAVNGANVHTYRDLLREVRRHQAGEEVAFHVSRDRKGVDVGITLGKLPEPKEDENTEERGSRRTSDSPFATFLGGQRENMQGEQGPVGFEYGGVYRSADCGETWERINSLNPRPMYFSQIRVDPSDENHLFVLGISLYRSEDGGKTFTGDGGRGGVHVDHHAMWIDPDDGRHMILGNDGGLYVTWDRMHNWDHHNHVAIGQFYDVAVGPRRDYRVYGGLQDNGSWGGPNRVSHDGGPANADWFRIGGGDGFVCRVDVDDPDQIYFESQNGGTMRRNLRTGVAARLSPKRDKKEKHRFNWKTPFLLSSHNHRIYYTAANRVFRSLDRGDGLRAISGEITRTDRGSATALAESSRDENILWVGTDDGALHVTEDGGASWTDVFAGAVVADAANGKAEHEEGNGVAADAAGLVETIAAPPTPPALVEGPLNGTWSAKATGDGGMEFEFEVVLRHEADGRVVGKTISRQGDGEIKFGRFDDTVKKLTFVHETDQMTSDVTATLQDDVLAGDVEFGSGFSVTFTAERKSAEAAAPPVAAAPSAAVPPDGDARPLSAITSGELWVSSIVASHHETERAYVTLDGHRSDVDGPALFVTEDAGKTWRDLGANLPEDCGSTRVISEDVRNPDLLFCGTEFGAWVSIDRGARWTRLSGLPTVAVHAFAIHDEAEEIVAATHGRSLWVMDLVPLRQLDAGVLASDVHLFRAKDAVLWRREPSRGRGLRRFVGANPRADATLCYWLGKKAAEATLTIRDVEGKVVAELEGKTTSGLHRIPWNLRRKRAPGARRSSRVAPGIYGVTLTVDEREYTTTLEVLLDPGQSDATWLAFEDLVHEMEEGSDEEEAGDDDESGADR